MTAQLPISRLQFDLATAVARMAQAHELGPDSPGGGHLVDRLLECDLPRLRGHLDAAGRALLAAADDDGPLPVRLDPPAGEAEPSPEQLAKIEALPDGSVAGVLAEDAGHGVHCPCADEVEKAAAVVEAAREAARRLTARLVATAPYLDKPYADAPGQSPWTRVSDQLSGLRRALGLPAKPGDEPDELERLRGQLREVLALHTEYAIYELCGHDEHDAGTPVVTITDGETCRTTPAYSVCRHCCAPGDEVSVDHQGWHDSSDCWPCPTRRAVEQP